MKRSVVVFVLLLGACGGGGPKIPDTTKVLDEDTLSALESVSQDGMTFTFSQSTTVLAGLAAGDVMVAAPHDPVLPSGTLRKVIAVDRGPKIVVSCEAAALNEAVETGSIHETTPLRASDVISQSLGVKVKRVGQDGIYFALNDYVLFDGDGDSSTTDDQVVLNGNIRVDPAIDFDLDIKNFSLKQAVVALDTDFTGSVNVEAGREASFNRAKTLTTLTFPSIVFSIGPVPVVLIPSIEILVGADGKVTAQMNAGVKVDATARVGFGYQDGSFGPIADLSPTASFDAPSFEDGVKGNARIWVGPRAEIKAYDVMGGFIELKGYVRGDIDVTVCPWWKLAAGIEGDAGFIAEIKSDFWVFDVDLKIVDYKTDPITKEIPVAQAAGCAPSSEPGQGGSSIQTWARSYGGSNTDYFNTLLPTDDGGSLAVGATNSFTSTPVDSWLVKLDALGHVSWQLAYEDLSPVEDVLQVSDGYVLVAGYRGSSGDAIHLIKIDVNGQEVWVRSYTNPAGLSPAGIVATGDGGFLVAGADGVTSSSNSWAGRFDGDGTLVWAKSYGGGQEDQVNAVAAASDGGFLLVGQTESFGGSFEDTWIIKLDGQGDVLWQKDVDGNGNEWGYIARESPLGGYLVGGGDGTDAWLARMTTDGKVTWVRTYDAGTDYDGAVSAVVRSDGDFVVAGSTGLSTDVWLMEVSDSGDVVWSRAIGGPDDDSAGGRQQYSLVGRPTALLADEGVLVSATSASFGTGFPNAWVLKVAPTGFVDIDPNGNAQATVLTGSFSAAGYSFTDTLVTPQTYTLTETTTDLSPISTDANVTRQGGLP